MSSLFQGYFFFTDSFRGARPTKFQLVRTKCNIFKKIIYALWRILISANNLNSCFTLMLLCQNVLCHQVKNFKITPRIADNKFSALCVRRHYQVCFAFDVSPLLCLSLFFHDKQIIPEDKFETQSLRPLLFSVLFFSKPQFVFSRHNKISPLLLSRLTLNSESTPCLFVAVLL